MLLFYNVIHEIQVAEPTNSSFGFGCENVCTRALLFGYCPFGDGMKDWVVNKVRYAIVC
jgi:hypothetical protein